MSKPTELVRVKDPGSGREYSMSRAHAKRAGVEILNGKPVRDRYGRLVPAKDVPAELARDKSTKKES